MLTCCDLGLCAGQDVTHWQWVPSSIEDVRTLAAAVPRLTAEQLIEAHTLMVGIRHGLPSEHRMEADFVLTRIEDQITGEVS